MNYQPLSDLVNQEYHPSDEFDSWNIVKKKTDSRLPTFENFPKKREVWVVMMGKNIGVEQNGTGIDFSRPMMVIKKFNNEMFWCVPLSTKQKGMDFYFNFTDPANQSVSAILAQLKLVSIKRFDRKMYECSWETFDAIIQKLKKLLG